MKLFIYIYICTMNKLRMIIDKTPSLHCVLYDSIKLLLCVHTVVSDMFQPVHGHN